MSLAQDGNIIETICNELHFNSIDELTQLDEICLVCLTEKFRQMEHCQKCNRCIKHFHTHSSLFDVCFGDANVRPFVLYHVLSLALCTLYLKTLASAYWPEPDFTSEFLLGRILLTHWNMPLITLAVFLLLQAFTVNVLEQCLLAFSAFGRGMTLNEFTHVETYKYLFAPVSVKKSFDAVKVKNEHKTVPLIRFFLNPFAFFCCSCRQKPLLSQRQQVVDDEHVISKSQFAATAGMRRNGSMRYSLLSKDHAGSGQ